MTSSSFHVFGQRDNGHLPANETVKNGKVPTKKGERSDLGDLFMDILKERKIWRRVEVRVCEGAKDIRRNRARGRNAPYKQNKRSNIGRKKEVTPGSEEKGERYVIILRGEGMWTIDAGWREGRGAYSGEKKGGFLLSV